MSKRSQWIATLILVGVTALALLFGWLPSAPATARTRNQMICVRCVLPTGADSRGVPKNGGARECLVWLLD